MKQEMASRLEVTTHAKVRYKERFDPNATQREAQIEILRMIAAAKLVPDGDLSRYFYPDEESPACVVVAKNGVVLTVVKPNEIRV